MKQINKAAFEDLPKILSLQKLSYLSEAKLLDNFSIQPLTQTQISTFTLAEDFTLPSIATPRQ